MKSLFLLFLLIFTSCLVKAEEPDAVSYSELEEFVHSAKSVTSSVSATSVILIKQGQVVKELHAGLADVENGLEVDENTVYYFASTTKSLMAFAVLLAEKQGKINQNSSLADMFPNVSFQYIDAEQYSVKDLLSHTSGLTHEAMTWTFSYTGLHDEEKRKQYIATLRPDPDAPKGKFNYTNLGYNLFAIWFDSQYKQGWQEALDQLIFDPLKLERITADVDLARKENWPIARPYSYKFAGGEKSIYMAKNNQTLYSVGVFARPLDVASVLSALMTTNQNDTPFDPTVIRKSQTQLVKGIESYFTGYGWGWMFSQFEGTDMLLHTGGFDGASVQISYLPEKSMGVIVVHGESGIVANELNGAITRLAYKAMLGIDNSADYLSDMQEMTEITDFVKRSQQKIVDKHAELSARTEKSKPFLNSIQGRYTNELVGDIIISENGGKVKAEWGDLKSIVYAGEKVDALVLEWRPGKFYDATVSSGGNGSLEVMGWTFSKNVKAKIHWQNRIRLSY